MVKDNKDNEKLAKKEYKCNKCNKTYQYSSGLSKHKKKCQNIINIDENISQDLIIIKDEVKLNPDLNLVMEFVKQQLNEHAESNKITQDFQKQTIEFQKDMFNQIIEIMKNSNNNINNGTINNNNYTQFNLQVYLNETCKNAMTIDEFLDYLQPTIEELEDTAHYGYVEGITRIIMRGLKDLEDELRPFHCTDLKRETLFIKNTEGEWEKETDEKPLLLKFVKAVGRKNFNNLNEWRKEHPNCKSYDSKSNDMFNKILVNSMSGSTEKEQNESYEKIIKNIMRETVIDKTKKNK